MDNITKTEPLEKIKYTVYRGPLEPVIEQRRAEINLYENHLELIYDYSFNEHLGTSDLRRSASVVQKSQISTELTVWHHEEDKDKTYYPEIAIYISGSYKELIYLENMEEAYVIYNTIKNWLLK